MDLPPKEFELLLLLASNPNRVFSREQLIEKIWGYDFFGDTRTVDVHVKRLREKIPGESAWNLKTVWGIGYKLEVT
jgi:DNA-binding response OmpR family regulator